jgi:hypothetical protein
MNFKFDDKDYDSDKLSNNGKACQNFDLQDYENYI